MRNHDERCHRENRQLRILESPARGRAQESALSQRRGLDVDQLGVQPGRGVPGGDQYFVAAGARLQRLGFCMGAVVVEGSDDVFSRSHACGADRRGPLSSSSQKTREEVRAGSADQGSARSRSASCGLAVAAFCRWMRGKRNSGTVLDPPPCAACSLALARQVFRALAGTELDWGTRSSLLFNYEPSVPL